MTSLKKIIGCKCKKPRLRFSGEVGNLGYDHLYLYCKECEKILRFSQKTNEDEEIPRTIATKIINAKT